jgi:hypothetical protein
VVAASFEMVIEIDHLNSLVASMATFRLTSAEIRFPLSHGYPHFSAFPTVPEGTGFEMVIVINTPNRLAASMATLGLTNVEMRFPLLAFLHLPNS